MTVKELDVQIPDAFDLEANNKTVKAPLSLA